MRDTFNSSPREEAAKKFNKEMRQGAQNDAFRNANPQPETKNKPLEQPTEYDLNSTADVEMDETKQSHKPGVNEKTELGNEIDPEKLGATEEDEELELDLK